MRTFLFYTLFLLVGTLSSAQERYTMKSGGRIFNSKDKRLYTPEVEENFIQEALVYYKAGRRKKTLGNIFIIAGLTCVSIDSYNYFNPKEIYKTDSFGRNIRDYEYTNYSMFIIGGGLIIAAIPIKLGFQNKIRKSVEIMNDYATKSDKASIESTNLLINQNGIGLSIQF